jgi:hypothetical protein
VRNHPLPAALENIETIARMEQEFLEGRSLIERIGDTIGTFVGTMAFVALHAVGFFFWILENLNLIPGLRPFDPFPFMLLSDRVARRGFADDLRADETEPDEQASRSAQSTEPADRHAIGARDHKDSTVGLAALRAHGATGRGSGTGGPPTQPGHSDRFAGAGIEEEDPGLIAAVAIRRLA